jgi:hypothetical protein
MSMDKLKSNWKRFAPYAVGLAVLGSVGVGVAERHARSCCTAGSACCHPGAACCHGHGAQS